MSEYTWRELERADMGTAAAHRFDEERRAAMTELYIFIGIVGVVMVGCLIALWRNE